MKNFRAAFTAPITRPFADFFALALELGISGAFAAASGCPSALALLTLLALLAALGLGGLTGYPG